MLGKVDGSHSLRIEKNLLALILIAYHIFMMLLSLGLYNWPK